MKLTSHWLKIQIPFWLVLLVACQSTTNGNSRGTMAFDDAPPLPIPESALLFGNPPNPLSRCYSADNFFVATNGDDTIGDGSQDRPWATISKAVKSVSGGSTVWVMPGTYDGEVRLNTAFDQTVNVCAAFPYQARLRHTDTVVIIFEGRNIVLDGFDIAHTLLVENGENKTGPLVVQIQDLAGAPKPGGDGGVSDIVIRNNIIHDSYNNDLLKIGNGAKAIHVLGNMFYNQEGSDEHIDVNSVTDVVIQKNVFFNDFSGSDRTNNNDTSAFVVIKDSNGEDDVNLGSKEIEVKQNVFLNWEGNQGYGFIQIGEDGTAYFEADGVLIENNLLLGNSDNIMRSPFGVMGSRNITVRNNTIVGDLPAKAYTMRLYNYDQNQKNQNVHFYNNLWSDAAGTMDRFSETPPEATDSFTLNNNLYWNNGVAIPSRSADLVNVADDANAVLGDPNMVDPVNVVTPRWNPRSYGQWHLNWFDDGSNDIQGVFSNFVNHYAQIGQGSAAIDTADGNHVPVFDIRGMRRSINSPDIGAFEY